MFDFILGTNIAQYVRRYRGLVILSLVLMAIASLFVVVPAYLLQPFIDEGMKGGTDPVSWKIPWIAFDGKSFFSWHRTEFVLINTISPNKLLILLTFVTFLSVLLKSMATYFSELTAAAFSNKAVLSLRIDLFKKFLFLPLGYFQDKKAGELIARATADITVMQGLIANILIGLIQHPLTILVFLAYLFFMNWKLTLLVFVVAPMIIVLVRLFGRKVKKHSGRVQDAIADVTAFYQENLLCLKVVQAFVTEKNQVRKFGDLANFLYKKVMAFNRWNLGLSPLMDSSVFLVLPAVLIIGKIYFHHSLGELISILYAFSRVYSPLKRLALVNSNLRTLQGATDRVFKILQTAPDIQDRPGSKSLPRHEKAIVFKEVQFAYPNGALVLRNISFKASRGEMIAFVGSTGAGKSTLLDLIPRFYEVTGGSITIDGFDIKDVTLGSLRKQIGIVNQDTILFHESIIDNIRCGNKSKDMGAVVAATKAANAHAFILNQPSGYDTIIGDQGTLLSGGQKQRLAIARAILINPSILILDEAASALDAESERLVQEAIEELRGSLTILVVAHRLSTIRKADRIYVLEGGEIVESGTQKELLALDGRFKELYDIQFRT
jgi:subfamily B ATP-binding cassette protein MsbA